MTDIGDVLNNGKTVLPSSDCRVVLHCCSRSPGSEVGKKTAAGSPAPLPEKSNRKPTAERRACHPGTPPTLPSAKETCGHEQRIHKGWHLKRRRRKDQHTDLILHTLLRCVHWVKLATLNAL